MSTYNLSVLFLSTLPVGAAVGIAAGAAVLAAAIGVFLTLVIYKKGVEKKVGSAEERVKKIISDAEKEAERIKNQGQEDSKRALKEALLELEEMYLK